jgi:hypothetical protein
MSSATRATLPSSRGVVCTQAGSHPGSCDTYAQLGAGRLHCPQLPSPTTIRRPWHGIISFQGLT